jgi:aspartyl-tRNA synthetase
MEESNPPLSKKAAAKAAKKAEKTLNKQMAAAALDVEEEDPLAANYGDVSFQSLQSKEISGRKWVAVRLLDIGMKGQTVLVRGRVHTVRGTGKMAFLVVREAGCTVQCVLSVAENIVSKGMVKYVNKISKESIVDVEGIVSVPEKPIEGTSQKVWHLTVALSKQSFRDKHKGYGLTQNCYSLFYIECHLDLQVEIQARKVYCISKAAAQLPLNLEDAARSERDFEKAEKDPQVWQYFEIVRIEAAVGD